MKGTLLSLFLLAATLVAADSGHIVKRGAAHRRAAEKQSSSHEGLEKRSFSGIATFFEVGLGACGKWNVESDFIVALNSAQYIGGSPGPECFKGIEITGLGKTIHATIMDECPTCDFGSLDMSFGLFSAFGGTKDMGVFPISWSYSGSSGSSGSSPKTTTKAAPKPTPTPTPEPKPTTTKAKPTPTPTPEPEPTTTKAKTTSTKEPEPTTSAKPSTTTTKTEPTTTKVHSTTTSAKPTTSSAPSTTSSASAAATTSAVPASVNNFESLNQLVLEFGQLASA